MNYREWLLHRAQHCASGSEEPEVLRYNTWRNYQSVRDWVRRSDAAHTIRYPGSERLASASSSRI
jgi:hypothetical protein